MSKISRALITVLFAGLFLPATSPVAHAANTVVNCGTSGTYTINETGVVISSSSCVGAVHFGSNVTAIGRSTDTVGVFQNNDSLTAITFDSSVKEIQTKAFNLSSFTSITFSEGLETIAANAFSDFNNTTGLDNVDLIFPETLKYIGDYAFQQTNAPYGKTGAVSFGTNLEYLGIAAFKNTPGRFGPTSITFRGEPKITTLPVEVFSGARETEIVIPANITSIANSALRSNIGLPYLMIPNSVTNVGASALMMDIASALRTLIIPDGMATWTAGMFSTTGTPLSQMTIHYCAPTPLANVASDYFGRPHNCARAVQYSANGGVGATYFETTTAAVPKALRLNTYTRSGYEFDGWNTRMDGKGTRYSDGQVFAFDNHLVLFAQWWDLSKPRPNKDNSAEVRRKRQAEIDAARNSLVQKIKAGETVVNPDLIAADVQQFNAEIAKKANADFQVAAKSKDFGFPDVRTVITKWSIYQDIENGVRSTVTGRTASAAGIIPEGVVQKQLLISRVQKVEPEKRASVEQIDKLIADLAKVDASRKAKLAEVTARTSKMLAK